MITPDQLSVILGYVCPAEDHYRNEQVRCYYAQGHFFCWECLGEAHAPATCSRYQVTSIITIIITCSRYHHDLLPFKKPQEK